MIGLIAVVTAAMGVSQAEAATADGVMITNTVCATFGSPGGVGFTVSYCATRPIQLQNPCISLQKVSTPTAVAAGGTMTYTLWVVNCSPFASAFNVLIADRLPENVGYDAWRGSWPGVSAGTWVRSRGPDGVNWQAGSDPPVGQATPYYLRFALDMLGPNRSAMQMYSVTVL